MAAERRVVIPYRPRRAFLPFHNRTQRWASLVVHRRGGKTVATVNDVIKRALLNERKYPPPRYAYIAPYYNQAKRIAWGYAKHYSDVIPGRQFNESELKITLPTGAEVRLFGADNPDALRGDYLDGAACDEFADWAPSVFPMVIRPMLADYRGWATFIGTPKGHNAFHEQHEAAEGDPSTWFTMVLRASQSGLIPADELADMRKSMTDEQYEQEMECSFEAAILGAYFGKEMAAAEREGRISHVPYDPELPVYTVWDLGKGSNMPVWFWQPTRTGVNVIDYLEGEQSDGIVQVLKKVVDKGYPIEADWVPHDAKAAEISTGRTRIETMLLQKRSPKLVADHKEDDGINAAKLTLPVCRFDRVRCKDGIEALKQFRTEYDEVLRVFRPTPLKNWAKHPADAFRYLAMAWRALKEPDKPPPPPRILNVGPTNTVTLNDIAPLGVGPRREERI